MKFFIFLLVVLVVIVLVVSCNSTGDINAALPGTSGGNEISLIDGLKGFFGWAISGIKEIVNQSF